MKNVEMKVEGNILTIKVDLTKEFGPSSSGKISFPTVEEQNQAKGRNDLFHNPASK